MSSALYQKLLWLPAPPSNFAEQCRSLAANANGNGPEVQASLQRLATHSLDGNQLHRLAKSVRQSKRNGTNFPGLLPFRLGIVSNGTTDLLVPCLEATALRYGMDLECVASSFDQTAQEALAPNSALNQSRPDAVLLALDYRSLPLQTPRYGQGAGEAEVVARALHHLGVIRGGIRTHSGALCILQTFAPPPEWLFGSFDVALNGTITNLLQAVNQELTQSIAGSGDLLLNVAGLAETVGLAGWYSPVEWNLAKLPFGSEFLPLYADHVCRLLAAAKGRSRRCLVLDLDNTLWGGVVGDDGLNGLVLARGDATGEAFLTVQRWALELRKRGIVLAVSSKNNDDVARSPFRQHPDMLLREEHIAVFQANWNDKATNIKAIADELALGLHSLVFLDDNPAERALIRQALPDVAVPELPGDPALYARTLAAAGYFEAVAFSGEDEQRADYYQDNARRVALQQSHPGDVQAYLASLQMEITFAPFDELGRARITQLINKSNQFNLRTKRYTEAEVAALQQDPECFTLQVRLVDIFGDNGMVSVVICRKAAADTWLIDTWLMSCRVLGRQVEQMVLSEMLEQARKGGIRHLIGIYEPSGRNQLVRFHYRDLGFEWTSEQADGSTEWSLQVDIAQNLAPPSVKVRQLYSGAGTSTIE